MSKGCRQNGKQSPTEKTLNRLLLEGQSDLDLHFLPTAVCPRTYCTWSINFKLLWGLLRNLIKLQESTQHLIKRLKFVNLVWSGKMVFAWPMLYKTFEPLHDKTNKVSVHQAKTQISLGICPVWSESSLSAWRKLGPLATHWAHSEDSDQTGWMPRLIWVFAGCTATLLVLSRGGSFIEL